MRKINKAVALGLVATMAMGLVACGDESTGNESTSETKQVQEESKTETTAETTEVAKSDASAIDTLIAATEGTVPLTVWCSELESYQTVMAQIVEDFKAQYPDVTFEFTIGAESEANCKDDVLKDVEAAADVFVFADDQINELVQAGALQPVVTTYTYDVAEAYGEGTISAASVDGKLYAYPLSASNGYFLYYNSEFVSEEQAGSWEGLLEAAKASGKKIGFDFGNVWYTYGWFAGAGLTATLADDGVNTVCNWNEAPGADVAQYINDLCANEEVVSIGNADAMTMMANGELIAYVDGTWDAGTVKEAYGANYAAAKLPTFTAAGNTYQMGSFAGYKFVGVNAYSKNVGWSMLFAEYVTNEANQVKIYEATADGPANSAAAAQASSPELEALAAQSAFATLQRVGGNFWSSGNTLGATLFDGTADVQAALDEAVAGITAPIE